MKKNSTRTPRNKQSSDALDWSYVEMQEHDFLVNEAQEFSFAFREEKE